MVVSSHSPATFCTGGLPASLTIFFPVSPFSQFISAFLQRKQKTGLFKIFTKKKERETKIEAKSPSFVAVNLYLFFTSFMKAVT